MKGIKALMATLVAAGLLVAVVPSSAGAAAYRYYVGCGLSGKAKPAHKCPARSKKGAFFKSPKRAVSYAICVRFPDRKSLCAKRQPEEPEKPEKNVLYVNKITSTIPGWHRVTWFVEGKRVGAFSFRVTE